jgi:uncharacterized protein YhfF
MIGKKQQAIQDFWDSYIASLPTDACPDSKLPESWPFGDGAAMADELGALVAAGTKTATSSLFYEYEMEGCEIPKPGYLSIVLDGRGFPMCLIETTEVIVKPFKDVDAQFAYDEGEGERSMAYWREGHIQFFTRACEELGCRFSEDMRVVCERFRLVYNLPSV